MLQTLRAKAHGNFRTSGRYAAATVRGTQWTISDRCNDTQAVRAHQGHVNERLREHGNPNN